MGILRIGNEWDGSPPSALLFLCFHTTVLQNYWKKHDTTSSAISFMAGWGSLRCGFCHKSPLGYLASRFMIHAKFYVWGLDLIFLNSLRLYVCRVNDFWNSKKISHVANSHYWTELKDNWKYIGERNQQLIFWEMVMNMHVRRKKKKKNWEFCQSVIMEKSKNVKVVKTS